MRKIAVEEHFFNPELGQIIAEWNERWKFPKFMDPDATKDFLPLSDLPFDQHRLPTMDKNEIDIQVISTNAPGIQGIEDPVRAVDTAKRTNDYAYKLISQYPDRFLGFAALPLQDPEAAAREMERCVKELGFRGAMIQAHSNFKYLDSPEFEPVWDTLEALDVPLSLHVFNPWPDQIRIYDGYPELLGATWNWGVEAATHALRMVFGGVFERHPKAKLIMAHLGESLPYLLGRIDEGAFMNGAMKKGRISMPPSEYFRRNVYVSTSGQYRPETLRCAISALGIDHIMFATDYPYFDAEKSVLCVENTDLSDEEKQKIYYNNAAELLHIV